MIKLLKFIAIINLCLVVCTAVGSWWLSSSVGPAAYFAGALAAGIVSVAACSALIVTYAFSNVARPIDSVTGVLLAMLLRMGLPLMAMAFVTTQGNSQLVESGFRSLLMMNYLVALPIETAMSLVYVKKDSKVETGLVQSPISK